MGKDQSQHITVLNNRGVELLASVHYEEAISTLSKALMLVERRWKNQKMTGNAGTPSSCPSVTSMTRHDIARRSCSFVNCNIPVFGNKHKSSQRHLSDAFIFRSPLQMCEENSCALKKIFIVMYNLALAHHLLAESQRPSLTRINWTRAKRLYQLAFGAFRNECMRFPTEMVLPILNNLYHVNRRLEDHATAESCGERLLTVLVLAKQARTRGVQFQGLAGFFSSVSSLILKQSGAASAA